MDAEKLKDALFDKMSAEQDKYRAWLVTQPPEEILNHTSEYTTREDILMAMEFAKLTEAQVNALLESPTPLADVYKNWSSMDFNLISPVYKYPFEYARDNNELEQFRTSLKSNIVCTREMDATISKYHDGYSFDSPYWQKFNN